MELETRLRSTAMRALSSAGFAELLRRRARLGAWLKREAPVVHYFHQADDPYSLRAVQKLNALREAYRLPFRVHLTSQAGPEYQGNSERFAPWALRDAESIAAGYGVRFPEHSQLPEADAVTAANAVLAEVLEDADFATAATHVGMRLFAGEHPRATTQTGSASRALAAGDALQAKLGHYQGAMFYFEGEWFWGLDRIRLLETQLQARGHAVDRGLSVVPEPVPTSPGTKAADSVRLEYFPSLRSPYTAIGHDRVLTMIERTGVAVTLRPVMPMLMRGVPAPAAKQRYIITDAAREGRVHGSPLGRVVDPFGDPVRRAFALFPAALKLSRGMEFVTAYLQGAWVDGVDIGTEAGLQQVAAAAGLDWETLQDARTGTDWEADLEENLQAMLGAGLWGVPSFRVSGGSRSDSFSCWGQDRIWRVEDEIAQRS
ncbi:MAG: DsbA family protein [Pseudomonadota bacterium]